MAKKLIPDQLHICMIANNFPILSRASDHGFLWPIAKTLSRRGHKVTVLAWKNSQGKRVIEHENVTAHFLGESTARSVNEFPKLVFEKFQSLHMQNPFHIVHSIDASGLLVGQNKKHFRVAMTYDVEATEMAQVFSILGMSQESITDQLKTAFAVTYKFLTTYFTKDRKLLKTADAVFVTSPLQRIFLERNYLYPDFKTFSIPYGIDVTDLTPREVSEEIKAKLSIPENAHSIMTISDMQELGEIQNLLKAFERVVIKKPNARLIILGNGPLFKEVEFQMLNLALGSKVIFAGAVSNQELPDYIALADVFVNLSSRTTGFEPSLLEAMAQKKLIIGSEVSPISTIVEDGVDGFLIRPADTSSLADILIKVFSDQLPKEQIGLQASQKIANLFDTNKMVNLTLDAYKSALVTCGFFKDPNPWWHLFKFRQNAQ